MRLLIIISILLVISCFTSFSRNQSSEDLLKFKIYHDLAVDAAEAALGNSKDTAYLTLKQISDFLIVSDSLRKRANYDFSSDTINKMIVENYYYLTIIEIYNKENTSSQDNLALTFYSLFVESLRLISDSDNVYLSKYNDLRKAIESLTINDIVISKSMSLNREYLDFLYCIIKNMPYIGILCDIRDIWNFKNDFHELAQLEKDNKDFKNQKKIDEIFKKLEKKNLSKKLVKKIVGKIFFIVGLLSCFSN